MTEPKKGKLDPAVRQQIEAAVNSNRVDLALSAPPSARFVQRRRFAVGTKNLLSG